MIIPISTGTATTNAIFNAVPVIFIFRCVLFLKDFELKTINGTVIMLIMLIIAVSEIDKVRHHYKLVRIFEVIPPGAAAIIITPSAPGLVPKTLLK